MRKGQLYVTSSAIDVALNWSQSVLDKKTVGCPENCDHPWGIAIAK
jgi:hypothetical protein